MIYLLDQKLTDASHSKFIIDIVQQHTETEVQLIEISANPTYGEIYKIIINLYSIVLPSDIVLCPWAVNPDEKIDDMFNQLAGLCWVVVAAGNFNQNIKNYSPARAKNVITVACLNKSGVKAALSNYSDTKELVWLPGTNYNVGWKNSSGTSVSAAVYAAFLAETLRSNNKDMLDTLISDYQSKVYQEINAIKKINN